MFSGAQISTEVFVMSLEFSNVCCAGKSWVMFFGQLFGMIQNGGFPSNISHSEIISTHLSQCKSNGDFIYIDCLYFKLWTSLFKSEKQLNKL